jgi:pimeloyl-ACP methyl ester carboxylesterase
MNSKIICAHHGSPGSARDFFHLKLLLPDLHFIFTDRVLDPATNSSVDSSNVQLGYSFGSVHAIISAAKNKKTEKVILIAPYLFPESTPSGIMSSVFSVNFLANAILTKIAPKKIEEMLVKSSHPKAVTDKYKEDAKCYLDPQRLKHALLEKKFNSDELFQALKELEKRNIEIFIIYGTEDQSSSFQNHIRPLLEYKNIKTYEIKNAGHALLWTHTDLLANLIKENIVTTKKFGYHDGVSEFNNVAQFLNDHKSKFPTRKILTWVNPNDLKNWNGDINTPLPHQSVTVAELDYLVGVLTTEFQKTGIKFGDRVILFLPMSLYMYASMFALQKLGAIPTFLDSWARRDQMGVSCKVALPSAMISAHKAFVYK